MSASLATTAVRSGVKPLLWATSLLGVIFMASFEQGAVTAGTPLFHELFHDARHLLGFPCH